jgi:adenosine deaminase
VAASPPASDGLRERFRSLPKTELHLHALGALRPATVVEWARRRGHPILAAAERGAAEGYRWEHLSQFVEFFMGLFGLVTRPEEFERATFEVLEDAARQGVRYAEVRWTPTSHESRGATVEGMWDGMEAGRLAAERAHGIVARWVVDFPRGLGTEVAERAAEVAVATRGRGTVGFDVAGDERAVAADPRFAPAFARARRGGVAALAHAGEGAGAESVRGALDHYGAVRIGHGTRSVEDDALLRRLAREGVPLEVCPSSNEALRVVRTVAEHPVRRFLDAGVPVCVSSDDPSLFGTDVLREHVRLHREAGLTLAELGRCAAHSFDRALLPAREREERLGAARREALAWAEGAA